MNAQSQTPLEETAEGLADAAPTMLFPRMAETIHWNRQRKNYRRQIEHDRASHAAILRGEKPPAWSKHDERDEDGEMGDTFSITGDTTHHHHYPSSPEQRDTETEGTPVSGTVSGMLKKAAISAALLGAGVGTGAGIPLAVSALLPSDPPAATVDTDTNTWGTIEKDDREP